MKCVHSVYGLAFLSLVACGGSSSETPMPLEPVPHSGPEPAASDAPQTTQKDEPTDDESDSAADEEESHDAADPAAEE